MPFWSPIITLRQLILAATTVATLISSAPIMAAEKITSFGNVTNTAPTYKVYAYRQADGVPVFSDAVPYGQAYELMEFSCYVCNPRSTIDWSSTELHLHEYTSQISMAANLHGVDPALIRALIHAESGFNPKARSRKGAMGLMQLMPGTANDMGVDDPNIATQNIQGGVKYLALLLDQYKGNVTLATAAYNAGPGTVDKYNGVPPFAETQTYVKRVKLLFDRYKAQS